MIWPAYSTYKPSGVPWIGEIPEDWDVVSTRYLCNVGTGDKDTVNSDPNGEYPFFVRSQSVERIPTWSFSGEAVLTAGDGAGVGRVFHYIDGKFDVHQRVYVFNNFRRVSAKYFFYYLSTLFAKVALDGSAKSTVDSLRRPMLTGFPVSFPAQPAQAEIVDFLDGETAKTDALIAKQEQLIATLREDRAATIDSAFPMEGELTPLKVGLLFAQTGPFGTQLSAEDYVADGVPVINPTHIQGNKIVPDPGISVSPEKAGLLKRHQFRIGDVVLGRKGEVDKSALVDAKSVGFVCGSDGMLLRPRLDVVIPAYLWWFFQCPRAHSQLEQWSVGSTVAGLNQTTMKKIRLPHPPLDEQRRTVDRLEAQITKVDALISKVNDLIETMREYRSALITDAVTGKIDVRRAA